MTTKQFRLYFCATFAWFFKSVVPFGDLPFIHALINATYDHKYSPLPSADFDSSGVLVSFLELREKMNALNDAKTPELSKSAEGNGEYL